MVLDHLNFRETLETTCSAENAKCIVFMNGYLTSLNENKVVNRFIKLLNGLILNVKAI